MYFFIFTSFIASRQNYLKLKQNSMVEVHITFPVGVIANLKTFYKENIIFFYHTIKVSFFSVIFW